MPNPSSCPPFYLVAVGKAGGAQRGRRVLAPEVSIAGTCPVSVLSYVDKKLLFSPAITPTILGSWA